VTPQLIIAAVIAAVSFGGAWQIQSWRFTAKENERAQQQLADQRSSAAGAIRRADNVIAAQSAATSRDAVLRRDAAGARTALVGLHDATEQAMRDAAATHAACVERTATLSELLRAVAQAGGEVSAQADRHANDAQTLIEAWPDLRMDRSRLTPQ
jgi:hypothetical protein